MAPALFTRASTRPNRSPTAAKAARTDVGIADVAPHRKGPVAELTCERAELVFRPGEERHGHPGIVQHLRDRRADALRGAGDHCDLPGEVHRRTLPAAGRRPR